MIWGWFIAIAKLSLSWLVQWPKLVFFHHLPLLNLVVPNLLPQLLSPSTPFKLLFLKLWHNCFSPYWIWPLSNIQVTHFPFLKLTLFPASMTLYVLGFPLNTSLTTSSQSPWLKPTIKCSSGFFVLGLLRFSLPNIPMALITTHILAVPKLTSPGQRSTPVLYSQLDIAGLSPLGCKLV